MSALPRLVVVLGPTASGKSALGIRLAEKLGGEILVCDSTQVYRHFDIGTAKVPTAEQHGIAHHLVDLCEPAEIFTAGDYRRRALACLGGFAHAQDFADSHRWDRAVSARAARRPGRGAAALRRNSRALAADGRTARS